MSVLALVAREAARARRLAAVASTLLPAMAALALLTFGAVWLARGRWLALPAATPFLVWLAAAVVLAWYGIVVSRRLGARATAPEVARAIEEEQALRRGELTGLLEVAASGGIFAAHAARALGDRLADVSARPAPRYRRRLRRAALSAVLALAQVVLLASVSWARRPDGWSALLHPVEAWRGTLLPALHIAEYPARVARGAAVTIGILAPGRPTVDLRWRATGGAWRDTTLRVAGDGTVTARIGAVDADLVLVAADGRTMSDTARVRVVDRPFVGEVTVLAQYPAYLGRSAERLAADEALRVPAGTVLEVRAQASETLASAALLGPSGRLAFTTAGKGFHGRLTPRASGDWQWVVQGVGAPIEDVPPPLQIEVIADSLPRPEILAPVGELLVAVFEEVPLELLAHDDHALTGVWLRTWVRTVAGVDGPARETLLSDRRAPTWVGVGTVEMRTISVRPGDAVVAVLVARDAAPGAPGTREGRSAELVLRLPTAEQAREVARAAADAAVDAARSAARAQAELAERTATEARTRSDRNAPGATTPSPQGAPQDAPRPARDPLTFAGAERAREIAQRQRALQEQVERLQDAAQEMEGRLRRAGALDTALAQQLRDAQRLLHEAMTPEMAASLQGLEQATEQLDGDRTRQSLSELAAQQERLREALEKSAEMLQRAALEGAMQTTADRGRDLAEAQRAFADSAALGDADPARAQELERQARDLERAIDRLHRRLDEARARPGAAATQQASVETRQSAEAMADAARDRTAPSRAASAMERAAGSLDQARQRQVGAWKEELTDALDRSVQEMMQMAREQDALAGRARQDPAAPSLRGEQSALQQGVQAAQERLAEQARRSALVTPRTQELVERSRQRSAQATREATSGQRGQTEQAMREAADALRQAAAQLTRDRERAASAQSATGMQEMLQQLSRLAQQQGGLNSQLQSLLPSAQGRPSEEGLDAAGRAQARALARAQREVARQLDEAAGADPSGRAQELAREARAIAQALDQGAVDPTQAARQERLLRRMLDAGRSLEQEQRDESQRREARAARATQRFTPAGEAVGRAAERYRVPTWEELRGLSAEDRRLVIEYFRKLNTEAQP